MMEDEELVTADLLLLLSGSTFHLACCCFSVINCNKVAEAAEAAPLCREQQVMKDQPPPIKLL